MIMTLAFVLSDHFGAIIIGIALIIIYLAARLIYYLILCERGLRIDGIEIFVSARTSVSSKG